MPVEAGRLREGATLETTGERIDPRASWSMPPQAWRRMTLALRHQVSGASR